MRALKTFSLILALVGSTATAAPVLTNGGFEQNPPSSFGNNIGHGIAPWVLGSGSRSNVVRVDGPGGSNYGSNGPEQDASALGAGVYTHYLDIADGANDFYQDFTPLCDGEVDYGAYFSRRPGGDTGTAGIEIFKVSDNSSVAPRQETNLPTGIPKTDPWTRVAYSATLTANTLYRFYVDMDNEMNIDNAFVVFGPECSLHQGPDFTTGVEDVTPPLEASIETVKTCEPAVVGDDGRMTAQCQITVTYDSDGQQPTRISLTDQMVINNTPVVGTITSISSTDDWSCPALPIPANSPPANCVWLMSGNPPPPAGVHSSTLDVTVDFGDYLTGDGDTVMNCARSEFYAIPALSATEDQASCVNIDVPTDPIPDPTPDPVLCTPFTPEVTCNTATGDFQVTLTNALSGSFDPASLNVEALTPGVTLTPAGPMNPLSFSLAGALAGDTVQISTHAVEAAGADNGLDLCCTGAMDIVIPEGLTCEKAPDRSLEVSKTCAPMTYQDAFGSDTECTITVNYSGPAPTPDNPIVVTDTIATGTATVNSHWPPAPPLGWDCTGVPGPTPVTCKMHNGIDTDQTPGYWDSYSTSFSVQMTTGGAYRNCAKGLIHTTEILASASGAVFHSDTGPAVESESCFATGDHLLEIDKQLLAEHGGVCRPGEPCTFTFEIANLGADDYEGPATLHDSVLVNGTTPGGTFTSISPALCDVADLTSTAGCTGNVSVPAGGSVYFQVTYYAPANLGEGPNQGQNCVALTDMSMAPGDIPAETDGKHSCVDFQVEPPEIEVVKLKQGTCAPDTDCTFTIEVRNGSQPFQGRIALLEQMTNGAANGVVTGLTGSPNAVPASCLPLLNPAACVMDMTLAPNEVQTFTVNAMHFYGNDGLYDIENCAMAMLVPDDTPLGGFDLNDPAQVPAGLAGMSPDTVLGRSCVDLDLGEETGGESGSDIGDPALEVSKSCTALYNEPEMLLTCALTVTGTNLQPGGQLFLFDALNGVPGNQWSITTPGGFMNPSDPAWTCQDTYMPSPGNLPTGQCMIATDDLIAAGGTMSVTVTSTLLGDHGADASDLTNCLNASLYGGVVAAEQVCVPIVVSGPDAPQPQVTLDKSCEQPVEGAALYTTTCTITVTQTGPPTPGAISVSDALGHPDTGGMVLLSGTGGPGFTCAPEELLGAQASQVDCAITGADLHNMGNQATLTTTVSFPTLDALPDMQNCAIGNLGDGTLLDPVCVDFEPPVAANVDMALEKTIDQAIPGTGHAEFYLQPQVISGSLQPGDVVIVTDPFQGDGSSFGLTYAAHNPDDPRWICNNQAPLECRWTVGASLSLPLPRIWVQGNVLEDAWTNCALVTVERGGQPIAEPDYVNNRSCVDNPVPPEQTAPVTPTALLEPQKASLGDCKVNRAAQTYSCDFELSVQNVGNGVYSGPIVLTDTFAQSSPKAAEATGGEGWTCLRSDGKSVSCLHGSAQLAPGTSSAVQLNLTIPGLHQGGQFQNCASIGIGESTFQRALLVQQAMQMLGIDGGPVDGAPGRKTRAGVRQLQEQLGLEATGEIDDALFARLGVPLLGSSPEACVTVDLPPMPNPPLACDRGTTVARGAACVCKYERMYQRNTTSCGCVKGYSFETGKGCVKRTSRPTTPAPEPAAQCDSRSTVRSGEGCECRYSGMRAVSPSQCICRNTGLAPIKGIGCPKILIGVGGGGRPKPDGPAGTADGAGGHTGRCTVKIGGICIK